MSSQDLKQNLKNIQGQLPENVILVAVSKTKPNEYILSLYEEGHLDFGENKVQDLVAKHEQLPKDIRWHFIGHLQRNKVKFIAPFVHLIHSVDSLKLLGEINKRAQGQNRKIACLLQVHIADEEHKFGFDKDELRRLFEIGFTSDYTHIDFRGLMGMATNTGDKNKVLAEFSDLQTFFQDVQKIQTGDHFNVLSMGMTGDYKLALQAGSNMLRLGSVIFGPRTNQ